jgi:hypothetical protein
MADQAPMSPGAPHVAGNPMLAAGGIGLAIDLAEPDSDEEATNWGDPKRQGRGSV